MTKVLAVTIAVEGPSDASVVSRIVSDHGLKVLAVNGLHGVNHLNAKLEAFNQAAKFGPWLVVRDLDHEAACAPSVVRARLPKPNAGMRFRIASRSIEAWLLADFEGVSAFFKVPREAVVLQALEPAAPRAYELHLSRCDRVVAAVLSRLGVGQRGGA
jgi:hypothetical protein